MTVTAEELLFGEHNWQVFDRETRRPLPPPPPTPEPPKPKTRRRPLTPDDPRHGTINGYNNLNCRCRSCTTAWVDYMRTRRRGQGVQPREEYDAQFEEIHSANRYSTGKCRCDECRRLASLRRRAARRKKGMGVNLALQKYPEPIAGSD